MVFKRKIRGDVVHGKRDDFRRKLKKEVDFEVFI